MYQLLHEVIMTDSQLFIELIVQFLTLHTPLQSEKYTTTNRERRDIGVQWLLQ